MNSPDDISNNELASIVKDIPNSLTELVNYFNPEKKSPLNYSKTPKKFHIYEMGRGIKKISKTLFMDFESTNTPWPYPFLRSAWFALFFTQSGGQNNYHIWFLKFPLDEQGKLVVASRDEFLNQFYEQIKNKHELSFDQADSYVADNPYGFKPSEEKMANINAILKYQQKLLPSTYYQNVLNYLFFPPDVSQKITEQDKTKHWQQWGNLGYQGLADLACHIKNKFKKRQIEEQLSENIKFLPIPMLKALSTCLEHHKLSMPLVTAIVEHAQKSGQVETLIACLRAISASDILQVNILLKQALNSHYKNHIELLAVTCGRCWESLKEPWLMLLFLEALALTDKGKKQAGNEAFNIMVSDLIFIPEMREHVLNQFRNPDRSAQLTLAIGDFYASIN